MYDKQTAKGLLYNAYPKDPRGDCEYCRLVKSRSRSIPVISKVKQGGRPWSTVATDVMKMKPTSYRGNRWNVLYACPNTKSLVNSPMRSKRDVLQNLKEFMVENVTSKGHKTDRLQSDSEAIYVQGKEFRKYLIDQQIASTFSSAYRHDQNGMLERPWQTMKDAAATVMKQGRIPAKYWDEVLPAVAKVWDVLPTKSTNYTKSPYEQRTGEKPDVTRFVPLGADAYVHMHKDEPDSKSSTTLRPNAYKGKVIGYPDNEKGSYRILREDGSVKSRYDVIVDHNPDHMGRKVKTPQERSVLVITPGNDKKTDEQCHEQLQTQLPVKDKRSQSPETPTREPSKRAPAGTPKRYQDQVVEPGTGNKGRVTWQPSINLADVEERERKPGRMPRPPGPLPKDPKNLIDATGSNQSPEFRRIWHESAEEEKKAFDKILEIVNYEDTIGHRIHMMFDKLHYKIDHDADDLIFKTRLVFNGATQRQGIDYDESYSPTLAMRSLMILIHIANILGYIDHQADIGSAYLQAPNLKVLYVRLPAYWKTADGRWVYGRLTGNAYGRAEAGRNWYFEMDGLLIDNGWTRSIYDICVYYIIKEGRTAFLGLVVDDCIIFSSGGKNVEDFLAMLRHRFPKVTDCKPKVFAGMELGRDREWTTVSQIEYLKKLVTKSNVKRDLRVRVPIAPLMDERVRTAVRPIVDCKNHCVDAGALRWLEKTRRDVQYALSVISQHQTNSTDVDKECIVRLHQYLANTEGYKLRLGGRDKDIRLFAIVDASKKVDSSMLSGLLFLSRDSGAVHSMCKKSKHVCPSSTDPEIRAVFETTKDIMWMRGFLEELGQPQHAPTVVYTDSKPAMDIFKSIGTDNATKYMIPVIAFIRQEINRGTIEVKKIKGTNNVADMGTKALSKTPLETYAKWAQHGMELRQYNGVDDFE